MSHTWDPDRYLQYADERGIKGALEALQPVESHVITTSAPVTASAIDAAPVTPALSLSIERSMRSSRVASGSESR
mgnify:CR=1 FL=1